MELTDRIIPARDFARRGPGRPPEVTDAELICLSVAQVLLRYDGERHWLRAAPGLIGHLFPRPLRQSEHNARLKALAPLMEAALRWLADALWTRIIQRLLALNACIWHNWLIRAPVKDDKPLAPAIFDVGDPR